MSGLITVDGDIVGLCGESGGVGNEEEEEKEEEVAAEKRCLLWKLV